MQQLPSPRLVTDSMGSGGTPHVSYGQSAPGSMGVEPGPQPFEVPDIGGLLEPSGPTVMVSTESDRIRDGRGRFAEDTGAWDQPGGFDEGAVDGAGWRET
jgi:hypothetical protein